MSREIVERIVKNKGEFLPEEAVEFVGSRNGIGWIPDNELIEGFNWMKSESLMTMSAVASVLSGEIPTGWRVVAPRTEHTRKLKIERDGKLLVVVGVGHIEKMEEEDRIKIHLPEPALTSRSLKCFNPQFGTRITESNDPLGAISRATLERTKRRMNEARRLLPEELEGMVPTIVAYGRMTDYRHADLDSCYVAYLSEYGYRPEVMWEKAQGSNEEENRFLLNVENLMKGLAIWHKGGFCHLALGGGYREGDSANVLFTNSGIPALSGFGQAYMEVEDSTHAYEGTKIKERDEVAQLLLEVVTKSLDSKALLNACKLTSRIIVGYSDRRCSTVDNLCRSCLRKYFERLGSIRGIEFVGKELESGSINSHLDLYTRVRRQATGQGIRLPSIIEVMMECIKGDVKK